MSELESLEDLARDLEALGWSCTLDAYADYSEGQYIAGRLQATRRYYGTFTVYIYHRIYWTPDDDYDAVEFCDVTWPVVDRIRTWIADRRAVLNADDAE